MTFKTKHVFREEYWGGYSGSGGVTSHPTVINNSINHTEQKPIPQEVEFSDLVEQLKKFKDQEKIQYKVSPYLTT